MIEELIPRATKLPDVAQTRRHTFTGSYRNAQACLRWDFGFTCPFCMLHEADLSEHGASGEGMIWIEHLAPRSTHGQQEDDYSNLIFSCRFCNHSRQSKPRVDEHGRRLLDPSQDVWSEHFESHGDWIKPKAGDVDAAYTCAAYKINEKQLTRRRWRRELIDFSLQCIEEIPTAIEKTNTRARHAAAAGDTDKARKALDKSHQWMKSLRVAVTQLRRFRAVPRDAPTQCKCRTEAGRTLPRWLARQTIAAELPDF